MIDTSIRRLRSYQLAVWREAFAIYRRNHALWASQRFTLRNMRRCNLIFAAHKLINEPVPEGR